jgi:hypothetical protein
MISLVLLELLVCRLGLGASLVHDLQDGVEDAFHIFPYAFIEIVEVAVIESVCRVIRSDAAQDRIVLENCSSS